MYCIQVAATREPGTPAGPGHRGQERAEQDIPGDGVHGPGLPARVPPLQGPPVRHQEGPDRFCLVSSCHALFGLSFCSTSLDAHKKNPCLIHPH